MRQLAEQSIGAKSVKVRLAWLPYATFLTAILVTLFAIFGMHELVGVSGWYHAAQHVMIFGSGFVAAGSIFSLTKTKREQ